MDNVNNKNDMTPSKRTLKQNKALHLYLTLLSKELNDAGLDMRQVLKPTVDIPWTMENSKEYLWRPIQHALKLKKSTTELTTAEVSQVYDILNRHISEKFGIYVPFPSIEETEAYLQSFN